MSKKKSFAEGLHLAADAAAALEGQGIKVISASHNGRKPVLVVERMPAFSRGVLTRRTPTDDGVAHVYATPYLGVQLEVVELRKAVQAVGHA